MAMVPRPQVVEVAQKSLVTEVIALMRVTAAEADRFPDLAREGYRVGFGGIVDFVADTIAADRSEKAVAAATSTATRFLELALHPLQLKAMFGADRWRTADAGMWELPEPRHYTMSKISCWQALTRAVDLAGQGHLPSTCVPRWSRERDRVAAWVDAHCWSREKAAYTFYAGTERLDASLTLAAAFGFASTARLSSTVDAIRAELGSPPGAAGGRPWIHRYSGARDEEGAFLACTFWLVEAYAELGRRDEAAALFEDALAALPAGVGVLAEMVDVGTGDFLGNLPQGLSHLALIHAAIALQASGGGLIHPADPSGTTP